MENEKFRMILILILKNKKNKYIELVFGQSFHKCLPTHCTNEGGPGDPPSKFMKCTRENS